VIELKTEEEIKLMRTAGSIVAEALQLCREMIRPGLAPIALDQAAEELIIERGGRPAFKGYGGSSTRRPFPASICCSIDDEVVHGIPGERPLRNGQIVSLDIGVQYQSMFADGAITVPVGSVGPEAQKLMEVCYGALMEAIKLMRPNRRLLSVSKAIQTYVEEAGFSVVRDLVGHGVGRRLHEEPQVPNYYSKNFPDVVLKPGMTIAVEPMINAGGFQVSVQANGWTVVTSDSTLSAHFEHTICIRQNGAEILTRN